MDFWFPKEEIHDIIEGFTYSLLDDLFSYLAQLA